MDNEIMVSIICNTYNHEEYIKKALDGFIMQKTNFKFEILIHDDASTDNTANIIREYEKKYPDLIKPIYQTENKFSQNIPIGKTYQYPRVNGKYIAFCEGDDYWISEKKLQKQYDFMEKNKNCTMACHNSKKFNYETKKTEIQNIIKEAGYISPETIIIDNLNGWIATASIFVRSDIVLEMPDFALLSPVGDYVIRVMSLAKGDVYYSDEVMSVYNFKVPGSWSSGAWKKIERPGKNNVEFIKRYNEYTNYRFNDLVQRAIKLIFFFRYLNDGDLKKVKSEEMREFYSQLSFKKKLRTYLVYYAPYIFTIRNILRRKH